MSLPGAGGDAALVHLRNASGDEASLSLHGGQLLSWRPAGQPEQLYASALSRAAPGKSVRGGVPVCFPQFSGRGSLPKHGFARNSRWQVVAAPSSGQRVAQARLQLDSAMASQTWDHTFCLVLVVRLGPRWIELQLQVANTGRSTYDFTGALHTYLAVDDVREVQLRGLAGLHYEDALDGMTLKPEGNERLRFTGGIDRVYRDVAGPLELTGGSMPTRRIVQEGFADAVVWNPGPEKVGELGDMPVQDWPRMLCVEAAVAGRPQAVAPGKTWRGLQRIELAGAPGFEPPTAG